MTRRRHLQKLLPRPDVEMLENRYAAGALGLSTVIRGMSEITNIVQVTSLLGIGLFSASASPTEAADPKAAFLANETDTPTETINTSISSDDHSADDYLPVLLQDHREGGQSQPDINAEALLDYNSKSCPLPTINDNAGFLTSLEGDSHSDQGGGGTAGASTTAASLPAANIGSPHASGAQTGQNGSSTLLNSWPQASPHLGMPGPQTGKSPTVGATPKTSLISSNAASA